MTSRLGKIDTWPNHKILKQACPENIKLPVVTDFEIVNHPKKIKQKDEVFQEEDL